MRGACLCSTVSAGTTAGCAALLDPACNTPMEEAFGDETRQLSRQCVQHRWDRVAKGFVWSGPEPPASMKPTSLGRQIFDPSNIMERLSEVERPLASDFLFHAAAAMVMHLSYNNMRRHCSPTGRYRASLSQDHAGCSGLRLKISPKSRDHNVPSVTLPLEPPSAHIGCDEGTEVHAPP